MNKKRIIILVVAIICFGLLIVGGTYAYMSFTNITINGDANGMSTCFIIDQDYANDDGSTILGGTLFQSSRPRAGLYGKVGMKISDSCAVAGTGSIYLTVSNTTSSNLYKKVSNHCRNTMTNLPMTGLEYDTSSECTNAGYQWISVAHCENSTTLETMTSYTTSSTCTSAGGRKWVASGAQSALKYAVYDNLSADPVAVGNINGTGTITLHSGFSLNHEYRTFYVYIWLDGYLADNTYLNMNFDGYIHLSATQVE